MTTEQKIAKVEQYISSVPKTTPVNDMAFKVADIAGVDIKGAMDIIILITIKNRINK